jgi:hypothetical protein
LVALAESGFRGNYWILLKERQLQGPAVKQVLTCVNDRKVATMYADIAATFHA